MKHKTIIMTVAGALIVTAGVGSALLLQSKKEVEWTENVGGFAGRVVNGMTGEPVRANVSVFKNDRAEPVASIPCDENGNFSVELKDGSYTIVPTMEGFVTRGRYDIKREIDVHQATRYVNAKLPLWPASGLTGRVTAGERGISAKIDVVYQRDASGAQNYFYEQLTTDDLGNFTLSQAYAGVVRLAVTADGFADMQLNEIILKAGEKTDLGNIPMREGVSVYGIVTDAVTHQGVAGVSVRALNASKQVIQETRSGSNGAYRLPPIDAANIMIAFDHEGYRNYESRLKLNTDPNREFDVELKRGWGLNLHIRNETKREPIQSFVTIKDLTAGYIVYEAILDNGTYNLDELRGGPYLVSVASYDKVTVKEARGAAGDTLDFVLKPFAELTLQVVTRQGTPVVMGQYRTIYTPKDGEETVSAWLPIESESFEILDLMPGMYRIEARTNDERITSSPEFHIAMGDVRNVKIQLTEGGVLRGRVVSSRSHRGVQATVEWVDKAVQVMTDEDGNFVFDQLPTTPFDIRIVPNNGDEKTFSGVYVEENSTADRTFEVNTKFFHGRIGSRAESGESPWGDGEPPWANGKPPWGDVEPPWANGKPPWGDGEPPWGDGEPPWGNGEPPWGDGEPPWGNGEPPWGNGEPPWGNGEPPWGRNDQTDNNADANWNNNTNLQDSRPEGDASENQYPNRRTDKGFRGHSK